MLVQDLVNNRHLTVEERILGASVAFEIIRRREEAPGEFMPHVSLSLLAEKTGLTKRKVSETIKSLAEKGIVRVVMSKPFWGQDGRFHTWRTRIDMDGEDILTMLTKLTEYETPVYMEDLVTVSNGYMPQDVDPDYASPDI